MPRLKSCKGCGDKYPVLDHHQPFQNWCGIDCGVKLSRDAQDKARGKAQRKVKAYSRKQEKIQRVSVMVRKNALKTRSQWLKEAQTQFNRYIRLRDAKDPCISCQRHHEGQYHAGHYMTAGGFPELRFNEDNCSKQCSPCNNHLSGNIAAYRINLVKKIGLERVESLEGPHDPLKLTIDEIKEIKAKYRDKAKELD